MSLGSTENKMMFEFGGQWEIVDHILLITLWSCTNLYLYILGLFFFFAYKWYRNIAVDNIKKKMSLFDISIYSIIELKLSLL